MHLPFHSKRPKTRKSRKSLVPDSLVFDDGRQVKLVFSFNRRAKRIILKMDPALRAVKITCPSKSHIRDALAFARTRQNWIEDQLAEAPRPVSFEAGNQVPFRGTQYEIVQTPGRSAHVDLINLPPQLIVTGRPEHIARRLKDWMKREARADFTRLADEISREAGLSYSRLAVRDMRTRWGSCSSEGALCFNWRLILAPPFVLRGVVAHEVAHLKYLNHGKKFWELVRELDPDNDRARDWLDAHGANLWVYGVTAPTTKANQSAVDAA